MKRKKHTDLTAHFRKKPSEKRAKMQIEYTEDESRVRWERNGVWHETDLDELIEAWERMPTIEPKKGKWSKYGFCSVCGEECITEWNETGGKNVLTPFCPNCGAQMERSEESD